MTTLIFAGGKRHGDDGAVAHFIEAGKFANGPAWLREVCEWARAQGEGNA